MARRRTKHQPPHTASPAGGGNVGNIIGGPYAQLLAECTDLGPHTTGEVQLTAALADTTTPQALIDWAAGHGLTVRWQPDQNWAYIDGPPAAIASAFDVEIHHYRSPDGQLFYASPQQPDVPAPLAGQVSDLGRILSYNPAHHLRGPVIPQDEPRKDE
jgi:kumamolisin